MTAYQASPIRRTRATKAEVEARREALLDIIETGRPIHLPAEQFEALKAAESSERDTSRGWSGKSHEGGCHDDPSRAAKRMPPRLGVNLAFLVKRERAGWIYLDEVRIALALRHRGAGKSPYGESNADLIPRPDHCGGRFVVFRS